MPIKTLTPTKAQINELRNKFMEKLKTQPPSAPFHPVDMDRVQNSDLWLTRFLEMYDLDETVAFDKLWSTCLWRQQYGAYDLNENNLKKEYLTDRVIFSRNKDIDGKPLLIFATRFHAKGTKNMDEVMRVVVYWIERIHRETNMDKITIVFDMSSTGLSGMDLDFVKRIIETFKAYYPNALNYILVFEMAWVLNAAFKVIKNLLPAKALEILKVIGKKEINQYIDKDNCLKNWGGNDDYEFSFEPEKRKTTLLNGNNNINNNYSNDDDVENNNNNIINNNNNNDKSISTTIISNEDTATLLSNGHDKKQVHFANISPTREPTMKDSEDNFNTPHDNEMLRVEPSDSLAFRRGENSEATVELTSTSRYPITYKIQTTSPDKFRVRPRTGVLNPNEKVLISILLKSDQQLATAAKDKFLVMSMPLPNAYDINSTQQIQELWKTKQNNSPDIEQHRLCCVYKTSAEVMRNGYGNMNVISAPEGNVSPRSIDDLTTHSKKLEKQIKNIQTLQYVIIFFMLIIGAAIVYILKIHSSITEVQVEHHSSCPASTRQ